MKLAAVAYPDLDDADRKWVEHFRARHDPQADRIAAHFTLVFPLDMSPETSAAVQRELAQVAQSTRAFSFVVERISVAPDAFGDGAHVFLVPDEGATELAALHDRLYGGVLQQHLRQDVPYTPHITVAAASDLKAAERLAGDLQLAPRRLRGRVSGIELVRVDATKVARVASYEFTP